MAGLAVLDIENGNKISSSSQNKTKPANEKNERNEKEWVLYLLPTYLLTLPKSLSLRMPTLPPCPPYHHAHHLPFLLMGRLAEG